MALLHLLQGSLDLTPWGEGPGQRRFSPQQAKGHREKRDHEKKLYENPPSLPGKWDDYRDAPRKGQEKIGLEKIGLAEAEVFFSPSAIAPLLGVGHL